MKVLNGLFAILLSGLLVTGCSKDKDQGRPEENGFIQVDSNKEKQLDKLIKVVDQSGQPIASADVMIGFSGKVFQTSAEGSFKIPTEWTKAEHITISKAGFVRATYMSVLPSARSFTLRQQSNMDPTYELTGLTSGHKINNGDDKIDFSIVAPTLSHEEIFHFDMNMIISSYMDKIEAAGQDIYLPSNVSLPRQKENYIIGITLDKPKYRYYFSTPGKKKVFASRGTFPFKKVVGELRDGKQFSELMNLFTTTGGSIREVNIAAKTQTLDIPVTEITLNKKRTVKSAAIGKDESLMGAAFSEFDGTFVPSDIKNFTAGAGQPLSIMNENSKVLSVLKRTKELNTLKGLSRLSVVFVDFVDGLTPQHLQMMEDPRVMSPYSVKIQKVANNSQVNEVMTFATMYKVKKEKRDGLFYENLTPMWEVFAPSWVDMIEIPQWPGETVPTGSGMRWSVSVAGIASGSATNPVLEIGPLVMQNITHVTSSAADF